VQFKGEQGELVIFFVSRCQILRLRCTEFDFGWEFTPDTAGGACSTPSDSLEDLRGSVSKGKEGKRRTREGGKGGKGRKRKEWEGKG